MKGLGACWAYISRLNYCLIWRFRCRYLCFRLNQIFDLIFVCRRGILRDIYGFGFVYGFGDSY